MIARKRFFTAWTLATLLIIIAGCMGRTTAQSPASASVLPPDSPKVVTVFIRVDDLFMWGSDIMPQEIDVFLDVAEKHDARVVLSTIPMRLLQKTNRDGKMTDKIRDYARRGHQIAQHGYDHRCPFSGRNDHEFYTPDIQGYSREEKFAKISEGKRLLEAVIGKKVVTYVGPGSDGKYMGDDLPEFIAMGFVEIPRMDVAAADSATSGNYGLCMAADDYTWAITEDTYQQTMEAAKKSFLEAAATRREWSVKFHDHFTRANYKNGITIRWLDELLTWLNTRTDVRVRYATFEDYYKMANPEFSTELKG